MKNLCKNLFTNIPSEYENNNQYLISLAKEGLEDRYEEIPQEAADRLEYELKTIIEMGYTDYLLAVLDAANWAKQNNVILSPGLGKINSSLVAFALKITSVNPLKHGFIFEEFIAPSTISRPNVTLEVSDDRRDDIMKYLEEKYGKEIFDRYFLNKKNKNSQDVKIDIQSYRQLGIIKRAEIIIKRKDPSFTIRNIKLDDSKTFDVIQNDNSNFINTNLKFEDRGYPTYFARANCRNFDDFTLLNSVLPSASEEYMEDFIATLLGEKEVKYVHEDLIEILEPTNGYFLYEEQVIQAIALVTGYSLNSSRVSYRILCTNKEQQIKDERSRFLRAAVTMSRYKDDALNLFNIFKSHTNLPTKSSAVTCSMVDYKLSYIKANYASAYAEARL